jgi:MoxR-like ATPase
MFEPATTGDRGSLPPGIDSVEDVADAMERTGYLTNASTAIACFLALRLGKPLFLEGAPGVGKTAIAHALAEVLDVPLIRLQCYEGIDTHQALYDWDFPRQLLYLRAMHDRDEVHPAVPKDLYSREFLLQRPILQAVELGRAVLLIDEIDRADDEFEAFLLETLSDFTISIPELGTVSADHPPTVIVTSNRTREVHDALKRRCYYLWLDHPDTEREVAIVQARLPDVPERLNRQIVAATQRLRGLDLMRPPGVAESLDWTQVIGALGATDLTPALAIDTLGAVVKYEEDQRRVADLIRAGDVVDGHVGE